MTKQQKMLMDRYLGDVRIKILKGDITLAKAYLDQAEWKLEQIIKGEPK